MDRLQGQLCEKRSRAACPMDPPQNTAEPLCQDGGASGEIHFKRRQNTLNRESGKGKKIKKKQSKLQSQKRR